MKPQKSKIITFYSYKGGVGRSMALANVAWLLSSKEEKKVLIVDWDIEAPGIHRYFDIPDEKIERGLIDLFYDYKTLLMEEDPDVENGIINVDDYIINVPIKSKNDILLLPAGRVDRKYPNKVNDFDWNDFYENWQGFGFIEYLKEQLKKKADFVLVDSRTGLSDISGICTMQIPDIVVLLFTSNEQNLYGTKFVCESISTKSIQLPGRNEPPKLILIPSRIESYLERDLVTKWEMHAAELLEEYLPKNENPLYIRSMSIPYLAYYSFGEKIAVNNDPHDGISESIEKLRKTILDFCSLLDTSAKIEARILDAITIQDPVLRNKLLLETFSELNSETRVSNLAKRLLNIALDGVKSSTNEELKVKTLIELSPHVYLVDTNEFLTAVKGIQDENQRASVLGLVNRRLLDSNAIELLDIIKDIKNDNLKTDLLIELINEGTNYPKKDSIVEEVHDLARGIQDDNSKIRLFIELLPYQSISIRIMLIEEVLNKLIIANNHSLAFTYLGQMVPYLRSSVEKDLVTDYIKILLQNAEKDIRKNTISILGKINSEKSIQLLLIALKDDDRSVGASAAEALEAAFQYAPNKQKVWNDLVELTKDKDYWVRFKVIDILGFAFSYILDKQQAWNDLLKLTIGEDDDIGSRASEVLGFAFSQMSDKYKQQAWNDLHRLSKDENSYIRLNAVSAIGLAFSQVPDKNKQQAWNDLHRLSKDEESCIRCGVAYILGSIFSQVPDKYKQQAWNDLIELTNDTHSFVRYGAAESLSSACCQVSNKKKVWNDLIKLTNNEEVCEYANYSLGKISIFNASQVEKEDDYKKELETAIEFFEKSTLKSVDKGFNPSQFCLPFYRAFHKIVFENEEVKVETDKYIKEAKYAVRGSKSKELLLEAIENLAEALKEVQDLRNLDLEAKRSKLNFYSKYCDRAEELMKDTEETEACATEVLRKGLPIQDRNLKGLLEEIQEKAKIAHKESEGTTTEEIVCAVNKEVQKWEVGSQEEIAWYMENLIFTLESKIPRLPENAHIFQIINEAKNQKNINKLLEGASEIIGMIPEIVIDPDRMKPTIGIITALPMEYAAVSILLENKNDKYKVPGSGAGRRYCLGEIPSEDGNKQYLALANVGMGNNIASTRASLLLEHFPNVKSIIMVGIAEGVSNPKKTDDHVRLGDIIVSNEKGIIQYDLIKREIQEITHRNPPRPPSAVLMEAVRYLEAGEILGNRPWEKYIAQSLSQLKTNRPPEDKDVLFDDRKRPIKHPEDPKRIKDQPRVFIGSIASANILQKDPKAIDELREKFGVKAVEMEASGIADATWNHEVGYLVVRGICDYCDSHKNDEWQQYAAVVAAAYTRALIESMP